MNAESEEKNTGKPKPAIELVLYCHQTQVRRECTLHLWITGLWRCESHAHILLPQGAGLSCGAAQKYNAHAFSTHPFLPGPSSKT